MTVLVLRKDWIECWWGGEPSAQPAHSSCGEGALQFGWGVGPSSLVPSPPVFMSLIHASFISLTNL